MRPQSAVALVLLGCGCSDFDVSRVEYEEKFVQADTEVVVDVLFVIDNSGTMTEEQSALRASFEGLTSLLSDLDADYQVGVITTDVEDPEQSGRLQGDTPIISPAVDDIEAAFASASAVGTVGSRSEQGLEAVHLAMTDAVADGANSGFFRADAALDVIVVSDEDDHSPGLVADYVAEYQAFKGERRVAVSAIVGDMPDGCVSPDGDASPGTRYVEAAQTSLGHVGSICLPDWIPVLEDIGFALAGVGDTFVLEGLPDATTLEVRVEEVLMPQLSPERNRDGWTYDPGANAILFTGFAVPRPGQEVRVTYYK